MSELPPIPKTWCWVKLPQTGEMNRGKSRHRPRNEPLLYGGKYPFIQTGDISQSGGRIRTHAQTYSESGLAQSRLWPAQTVCITIAANIAESALLTYPACFPDSVVGIIANPKVCVPEHLEYFIRTAKSDLAAFAPATAQANINMGILNELFVPLPPLAEQRRIVAKLEKLLGQVDTCRQRLEKMPPLLKRFRQSILAAACSGRLTADWREENSNVKDAALLIKDAQFQISESQDDLSELPETWKWIALGNYARCFRGRFSPRPRNDPRYFDGKYPFIQIGNLPREGGLVSAHVQTLNDEGLAVSRKFPKGTVVIAIVGATIGNTGVLAYDMCVTDSIVGLETDDELGNRYVELFLRHKKEDIRQISYSSGGQPNINLAVLNPYPLALPPLAEQQEIVRRVESLFALADQLELRLAQARGQVDKLTPSLLARAFAGKLVPQNPEDEPAEKLLGRIKNS